MMTTYRNSPDWCMTAPTAVDMKSIGLCSNDKNYRCPSVGNVLRWLSTTMSHMVVHRSQHGAGLLIKLGKRNDESAVGLNELLGRWPTENEMELTFGDALRIARGCTDYGGGYRGNAEHYEIYQHGIQTVIAALMFAARNGLDDTQIAVLHAMGANSKVQQAAASEGETINGADGGFGGARSTTNSTLT